MRTSAIAERFFGLTQKAKHGPKGLGTVSNWLKRREGLFLAEEVARALVSVIRVDDRPADRVLLRVRQITRNAVRVAEVVLRIPIWCSAQST